MQLLLGNLKAQDHLGDVMLDASITHTHSIIHSLYKRKAQCLLTKWHKGISVNKSLWIRLNFSFTSHVQMWILIPQSVTETQNARRLNNKKTCQSCHSNLGSFNHRLKAGRKCRQACNYATLWLQLLKVQLVYNIAMVLCDYQVTKKTNKGTRDNQRI
jgi:hypothetical protein